MNNKKAVSIIINQTLSNYIKSNLRNWKMDIKFSSSQGFVL